MLPMATRTRTRGKNSKRKAKNQIEAVDILILALLLVAANFFIENTVWLIPALVAAASIFVAYKRLTRKRKRKILLLKELDDLSSDGKEFEERVKLLLEDLGWHNTQRRGGPGDGGVDLVTRRGEYTYVVQCKYYKSGRKVDAPEVRELLGARQDEKAYQALFVTSSDFTIPARELAARNDIKLWDREELGRRLQIAEEHKQSPEAKKQQAMREYVFWGVLLLINIAAISGSFLYFEGGL
jgi:restriction system protein